MSLRTGLAFASSLLVMLLACGGSTTAIGDGGAGSDGGGGDGGGGSCTTATLPGDRACVPPTAKANAAIEVAVDAANGCLGCFTTFEPCKVDVSGNAITIAMITKTCPPPGDQACPTICALPGTKCTLPPLAAGTYTVKVTGEGGRSGLPPRELVVTADSTTTSCALPQPPNAPPPLDGSGYGKSCASDGDCALATVGDVCQPCKCPNLAIAKTSTQAYAGDYRARLSQCRVDNSGIQCSPCAPVKASCTIASNALVGTCELKPGG